MASFKKYLIFFLSVACFIHTLWVIGEFIQFLSSPKQSSKIYTWIFNLLDDRSRLEMDFIPLITNTINVILFIMQHSLMKSIYTRKFLQLIGLGTAERALYCLSSSLCLHYLMQNWISVVSFTLWQVNILDNSLLLWMYMFIHVVAWLIICVGCINMDLLDMLGITMSYEDMKVLPGDSLQRSFEKNRLYGHMPHPSFIGFSLILWANNSMTLDRFLLATILTLYMYFMWSTTSHDVNYQKYELQYRKNRISYLRHSLSIL